MQPVVPVYDVQGNFASGKAVGLGNNTNPLKAAYESRNNVDQEQPGLRERVCAASTSLPSLTLRSSLGFNVGQGSFTGFNPIYSGELRAARSPIPSTRTRVTSRIGR